MNRTALILTVLLVASSCRYKELCYDHSHTVNVRVIFNWKKAPDANPESMSLFLFPKNGEEYIRYEFTDRKGGTIRVPVGEYDAMCLNSDTENITYRSMESIESFTVSTRSANDEAGPLGLKASSMPKAPGTEQENLVLSPDYLWSGGLKDLSLRFTDEVQTIEMFPEQSFCRYSVEIRNATNLKYAIALSGSLSSVSGGWIPGQFRLSDELVTLPFNVRPDKDNDCVNGSFLTFGHCPDNRERHNLVIYAILSDHSKWYCTYDVTEQIHSAPDQRDVKIVLDGLTLPKPIVNGGGFQPSVNDWQHVRVEIKM